MNKNCSKCETKLNYQTCRKNIETCMKCRPEKFCITCNKKISGGSRIGRCRKCNAIENNAFKGKKHKLETIEKLKNKIVSEETRKKMSDNHADVSGKNNPMYDKSIKEIWTEKFDNEKATKMWEDFKETNKFFHGEFSEERRKKISDRLKGDKNPAKRAETRQKLSVSMTNRILNGEKCGCTSAIGSYFNSKKCKNKNVIYCRSNLEKKIIEELEDDDDVIEFLWESMFIAYVDSDGHKRRYIPDAIIKFQNKTVMIEIKPERFLVYKNVQEKIKCAKAYCSQQNIQFECWRNYKTENIV